MPDVLQLVDEERIDELFSVLQHLSAQERKALVKPLRELRWRQGRSALALAAVACMTSARQVAETLNYAAIDGRVADLAAQLLETRQPAWLPELPQKLLDEDSACFALLRALVRRGTVERPTSPLYSVRMVFGLAYDRGGWPRERSPLDALRHDSGLLDIEIWGLFHAPDAGRTLLWHDNATEEPHVGAAPAAERSGPEHTWRHALVTLASTGEISRDRLIDECLGAYFRDFAANDLGWYGRLHESLALSVEELAARLSTYGRLLTTEVGSGVNVALKAFGQLQKAGCQEALAALPGLGVVLQRGDKGPPKAAIALLAQLAKSHPGDVSQIRDTVVVALDHENNDIKERALSLLARIGGAAPGNALAAVSISATTALEAWRPQPVDPMSSATELADSLTRLIEEADDPIEIERVLDGVLRFAKQRPPQASVLAGRAQALLSDYFFRPWSGEEIRADLAALTVVWLTGATPGPGPTGRFHKTDYRDVGGRLVGHDDIREDWTLQGITTRRLHAVAGAVHSGGCHGLLSLPTASDGSIAPELLPARLASAGRGRPRLPLEVGVAALRLPRGAADQIPRARMHPLSKALAQEHARLQRHEFDWQLVVGRARANYYTQVMENAVCWKDNNARSPSTDDVVSHVLDLRDPLPLLGLQGADGEHVHRYDQVVGCWPLLIPHHPDLLGAHAHARLNRALTKNRSGSERLLQALGRATQPLGMPACSALLLGMAARNGSERTHAVDAVADLALHDNLDGHLLGIALHQLASAEAFVGSRVAQSMSEARRIDPRVSAVIAQAIEAALPVMSLRRDAHDFVDVLASAAHESGRVVTLPEELRQLALSKANTLLARACRRVPVG